MLKIKNNINLKELEKYGMRYVNDKNRNNEYMDFENIENANTIYYLYFDKTKYLMESGSKVESKDLEILYDLIKADLIEKVEE